MHSPPASNAHPEKLHIINGLHGLHTSPSHSAFFGALGGYRDSDGVPPSGPTIDYELSRALPETLLPHLCIGMDSMENMKGKPTVANLSARGAGKPIFMHSNPNHLYEMLYGGISEGDIRSHHEARSGMLDRIEHMAAANGQALPVSDARRYGEFVDGFGTDRIIKHQGGTVAYATSVKSVPVVLSSSRKHGFENYADFHSVNSAEATA